MSTAKAKGGKGTPATIAAAKAGVEFTLHAYEVDPNAESYGEAAADALGVPHDRLFKTLLAEIDGNLAVGVVPVSSTLDLKALAAAAGGKKARMADPRDAERATGYVVGGISPPRNLPAPPESGRSSLRRIRSGAMSVLPGW